MRILNKIWKAVHLFDRIADQTIKFFDYSLFYYYQPQLVENNNKDKQNI